MKLVMNCVNWDVASFAFNADWTAVDTGFDKSDVLSTFPNPINDFVISVVLAFKSRLLIILDNVKLLLLEYVLKLLVVRKVPKSCI